ncbi:MAG: nucleotidyltransferase family protein, partial [Phycisphaeraceae bacterium JB051]
AGKPLIDYWFDRFAAADLFDVRINNHHLPLLVRDYINRRNEQGVFHVSEAYEPQLLGSAGTVHANRDFVHEDDLCVIVYADNLSDVDLGAMIQFHQSHDDPFTMLLFRAENPKKSGIATLDNQARIIDFVEKPENPTSDLANAGIYVLDGKAYHEIADMNAFDLGFDVLPKFIGRMRGWEWQGYHRDIGTHASLEQAQKDVMGGLA